jgi:hypothetical protein
MSKQAKTLTAEELRRVLNEPLADGIVPTADNVNKDAIRALVDDVRRRLPGDYDDAFDEKGWRAAQYLDKYLEDLNAVDDGLIADRANLNDAIRNLRSGKEPAFAPLADALENMGQGIDEAVVKRPVVTTDDTGADVISVRQMVYLALTYDHRLVDGADAARFLSAIKARLEEGAFEADLGL